MTNAMSCEFCPEPGAGRCQVCGFPDVNRQIVILRADIQAREKDLETMRRELAALLVEAGRRPGDGSDQPSIFEADEPKLF